MINPTIRNAPCGVFDFSVLLSQGLQTRYGCRIEIAPQSIKRAGLQDVSSLVWGDSPEKTLVGTLDVFHRNQDFIDALIVQYSGYGYAESGAPVELVRNLSEFRIRHPEVKVITFFHELYALAPPWRRAYWNSRRQRVVVRELARISDHVLTNCEDYKEKLVDEFGVLDSLVQVQSVPSNVGEPIPKTLMPIASRESTGIVFGGIAIRKEVFDAAPAALNDAIRKLKIRKIVEIGPGASQASAAIACQVEFLGVRRPDEISSRLANSRYGFISYPMKFLGKSTVFSAFQAHGLVPVNLGDGENYLGQQLTNKEGFVQWNGFSHRHDQQIQEVADQAVASYPKRSRAALICAFGKALGFN